MSHDQQDKRSTMTRRDMLQRLGLAASAFYAAPVMMQLSPAHASGKGSGRPSGSRGSGPSRSYHGFVTNKRGEQARFEARSPRPRNRSFSR